MKTKILLLSLAMGLQLQASGQANLPTTLPELASALPGLVHSKQMQFGPYTDAVWAAYQHDPSSAASAIPILSNDLKDSDPQVQFDTLVVLQALAMSQNSVKLMAPLMNQLANSILKGDQYVQTISLMTVSDFGTQAPDTVISPIEHLLSSKPSSKRVVLSSARALVVTRPADEVAQSVVLSALNEPTYDKILRQQLIVATATPTVGSKIAKFVVDTVNSGTDKDLRDAGIVAAAKIGSTVLFQVNSTLNQIAGDASETLHSHQVAHQALMVSSSR